MNSVNSATAIPTPKHNTRKTYKPTKNQILEPSVTEPKTSAETLDQTILEFQAHQTLMLAFSGALAQLETSSRVGTSGFVRAFKNAFECYAMQRQLISMLEECGVKVISTDSWADQKYYNLTEKDLFDHLSTETQTLLLEQGLTI